MDGSKENYLRREWLNERESMTVEDEKNRHKEEEREKNLFKDLSDKDLFLVHLLKILTNVFSKSTNQSIGMINKAVCIF